jgi:hypothetical protein
VNNNEIFLNFWQNFKWPEPEQLYYRLYYNDQGQPICYSRHAIAGKFIELTPEQFAIGDMNVDVVDGVLVHRSPPPPPKLRPAASGTACHTDDVTVVIKDINNAKQWNLK